jgi:hypothetical protein
MSVIILAGYKMPTPIGVAGECLGAEIPIEIGGQNGKMKLPKVSWHGTDPSRKEPRLEAPDISSEAQDKLLRHLAPARESAFNPLGRG